MSEVFCVPLLRIEINFIENVARCYYPKSAVFLIKNAPAEKQRNSNGIEGYSIFDENLQIPSR